MHLILGSELVPYTRCVLEAKLNVTDFEINKERDAPGTIQQMGTGTVTVTISPRELCVIIVTGWFRRRTSNLSANSR